MAGQSWSIMIKGCPAGFDPDVYGTDPGQPLKAQIGDLVSWNNQTGEAHQICLTDEAGNPIRELTDRIAEFTSSFPGYVTQQADISPSVSGASATGTIYYQCSIHPDEKGQITVVS